MQNCSKAWRFRHLSCGVFVSFSFHSLLCWGDIIGTIFRVFVLVHQDIQLFIIDLSSSQACCVVGASCVLPLLALFANSVSSSHFPLEQDIAAHVYVWFNRELVYWEVWYWLFVCCSMVEHAWLVHERGEAGREWERCNKERVNRYVDTGMCGAFTVSDRSSLRNDHNKCETNMTWHVKHMTVCPQFQNCPMNTELDSFAVRVSYDS